jgi:MFS family permease
MKHKHLPYGLVTLFICALSVFFSGPGQTYFTSVFVEHYIREFGWSRSTISSLYSVATLFSGSLLLFVGRFSDKFGSRKVTLVAAFFLGISCLVSSLIHAPWMLLLVFFLGRINGQGSLTLMPATILPRWFVSKRAFAFSLMSLGGVLGSALMPPLNHFLISQFGWRLTWRLWALIIWLFFLPLVYLFLYDNPGQMGLLPDLGKVKDATENEQKAAVQFDKTPSWTLREAMRVFPFWGMLFVQALNPMISTGITFHFISLMSNKNVAETDAPFLLSLIALTSLPTTLLAGTILNKIKTHHAGIIFTVILSSSLTILLLTQNKNAAILFAVLQGMAQGLQIVWGGLVWPDYFGTRYLGSIRGLAMTINVIASAIGPFLFGAIFDQFNSYMPVLYTALALVLVSIIVVSLSPKPRRKQVYKNAFDS